ncbi:MAG: lanthionine synthetase LanC family protein [Acidimicrobiia bacterium]
MRRPSLRGPAVRWCPAAVAEAAITRTSPRREKARQFQPANGDRGRALAAAEAIASSIAERSPDGGDPSLCSGDAGLALLFAFRAAALGDPDSWARAHHHLDRAIDAVATRALLPSLWTGFPGVAWVADLVGCSAGPRREPEPEAEDGNTEVDATLALMLARPRLWPAAHDLVSGATGIGVYALDRDGRPDATTCLRLILDRLEDAAHHDGDGTYWVTPDSGAGAGVEPGAAHGVAGPVALLGNLAARSLEPDRTRWLLDGAVGWLLAHAGDCSEPAEPGGAGWCRGLPGIAAALLVAGAGAGVERWIDEAVRLARAAAGTPGAEEGVVDASLCHGSAGLAHLYGRMSEATGDRDLGAAAHHWLGRTLTWCDRARILGPGWVEGAVEPLAGPWTGTGLDQGAAGVALALLAAAASMEPVWDRMFLLSLPPELDGGRS